MAAIVSTSSSDSRQLPLRSANARASLPGTVLPFGARAEMLGNRGTCNCHNRPTGRTFSALRTFARLERMDAPEDVRTAGIRSAAAAAWLGLIALPDAEAAVRESRQTLGVGS